ncbi:MAG: glycosyltransferase [Coriobacteriia bacterium]|nr:glycosyltransferase [Coriobacteriia bacterium]
MSSDTSGERIHVMVLTYAMTAGGSRTFISTLLEHLDRDRYRLSLASILDTDEPELPADVPHFWLSRESPQPAAAVSLDAGITADFGDWVEERVRQLVALVVRESPDVLVCAPEHAAAIAAAATPWFPAHTRVVGRIGAAVGRAFPQDGDASLYTRLLADNVDELDRIVGVSQVIADDMVRLMGADPTRVVLLHNPVDVSRIRTAAVELMAPSMSQPYDSGEPVLLFVGRLERVKGLESLLRAFATLRETIPVQLVIVGDGSRRNYLDALAVNLGIRASVTFVGTDANPYRHMSRATLFVLPSRSEGMPNVLLESMACGCPIVATDIEGGATRELLADGECGVLVPVADADALTEAIGDLVRDRPRRDALAQRGLVRVSEFDPDATIARYDEVLAAVAQTPPRREQPEVAETPDSADTPALGDAHAPGDPVTATVSGSEATAVAPQPVASGVATPTHPSLFSRVIGVLSRVKRAILPPRVRMPAVVDQSGSRIPESTRTRAVVLALTRDVPAVAAMTDALSGSLPDAGVDVVLAVASCAAARAGTAPVAVVALEAVGVPATLTTDDLAVAVPDASAQYLGWAIGLAENLALTVRETGADVVIAQGYDAALPALIAKRHLIGDVPLIVEHHGRISQIAGWWADEPVSDFMREYLPDTDALVVSAVDDAADMADYGQRAIEKVAVIEPPIDAEAVLARLGGGAAADEAVPPFTVVLDLDVDSWDECAPLFAALSIAREKEPSLRFVAIGRYPDSAPGEGVDLELADVPSDAGSLAQTAAVLVHWRASVIDSLPDAPVAALLAGVPVLCTRASEHVSEVLSAGVIWWLATVPDADDIAEDVLTYVWARERAATLGDAGRQRVGAISAQAASRQMAEIISTLVPTPETEGA